MEKQKKIPRSAGVLMPLFSLPSEYGTGTMGSEAYRFVDFLSEAGLRWWQILPLVPPDKTGSPYGSCSAFAGSVVYISPEILKKDGLTDMKPETCKSNTADYKAAEKNITEMLRDAFNNFPEKKKRCFEIFCTENAYWLDDYAEYTALKEYFNGLPWNEWDDDIKFRDSTSMDDICEMLSAEIKFHKFCQYEFFRQWSMLRKYAAKKNVKIIGDIPVYVSYDSADVWAAPENFLLDCDCTPTLVAGVPPDMFSETGQLWGNPIYNWSRMEKQDFSWWKNRIKHNAFLYDMIRIDHFIGLVNYYAIPYGDTDATKGSWLPGPGMKLIQAINEVREYTFIIAEDLGSVTDEVKSVLKKSGYPGMKLMEFAFETNAENPALPHNLKRNCIVYGGTHDNETLAGYFSHQKPKLISFARDYLDVTRRSEIPWGIIRAAFRSTANLTIFQMQDYLNLDNSSRINTPSTTKNNWQYRFDPSSFSHELSTKIKRLVKITGR